MALELFELELLGGAVERRYRRMRPEVEDMPWGTLRPGDFPVHDVVIARRNWTGAAFQEHRTGVACALTLRALMEARAPLDLVALATRFPLDEMVHVELCARMAMELGGGTDLRHDPDLLTKEPDRALRPLMRAAELVVRNFCVGEALSIPLLRGTWHVANHPLARAVLGRIVRDEAAHGAFGWMFLDWAAPELTDDELKLLAASAREVVEGVVQRWDIIAAQTQSTNGVNALGWMRSEPYLDLARCSMREQVLKPLADRGIHVDVTGLIGLS